MSERETPTAATDAAAIAPPTPRREIPRRGGGWFFVVVLPGMALAGLAVVWTIRAQVAPVGTATAPATTRSADAAPGEEQKIDALIQHIAALQGAVFIRNRTDHTPAEAAEHLRTKRGSAGRRVTTARQFIDQLATESSMTGEPYRIRFADGTTVRSGEYLTRQLAEIESAGR